MRTVTASEANQQFSRLLGEAKAGEEITITQRGQPVAKLVPVANDTDRLRRASAYAAALRQYRSRPHLIAHGWNREALYERDPVTD